MTEVAAALPPRSPWARLERSWRVLATGASFALFGLGGLLLWFGAFPLLHVAVRDRRRCARLARRLIRHSFRLFIGFMHRAGVLTYEVRGRERLQRDGLLILANHPTLLDVVFLISLIDNANCVVKAAVARNPFMRGPARACDFICNDEGPGLIDDCIASLRTGSNLILFPEGTRTPFDRNLGPFQRGAANIAVRGEWAITPVLIRCEPPTLKKGQKWYDVPLRRMHFTIDVRADLPIERAGEGEADALAARRLNTRLRDFFAGELARASAGTGNQTIDHCGPQS